MHLFAYIKVWLSFCYASLQIWVSGWKEKVKTKHIRQPGQCAHHNWFMTDLKPDDVTFFGKRNNTVFIFQMKSSTHNQSNMFSFACSVCHAISLTLLLLQHLFSAVLLTWASPPSSTPVSPDAPRQPPSTNSTADKLHEFCAKSSSATPRSFPDIWLPACLNCLWIPLTGPPFSFGCLWYTFWIQVTANLLIKARLEAKTQFLT